jgi:hypothetical protein
MSGRGDIGGGPARITCGCPALGLCGQDRERCGSIADGRSVPAVGYLFEDIGSSPKLNPRIQRLAFASKPAELLKERLML